MISVVMALYNSNQYLEVQLDSLRRQRRMPDEVILVDDGSANDTVVRVRQYIQEHGLENWKLVEQPQNLGFVKTFRHALSEASGDILFLCDHDDIWMEDKIEVMAEVFESTPDVQALAASFIAADENGQEIEQKLQRGKSNNNLIRRSVMKGALNLLSFEDLAAYNISPGCTCAITSSLKERYLALPDLKLPHDWALCALASLQKGLFYLDRPVMYYRLHSQNTLGLTRQKQFEKRKAIAMTDWKQKQDLAYIVSFSKAEKQHVQYIKMVESLYGRRYKALEQKSLTKLIGILLDSFSVPYLYETLGSDILALLREGKQK